MPSTNLFDFLQFAKNISMKQPYKLGDLFSEVNSRHCYVEVTEFRGKIGFRGLLSGVNIRITPLWALAPECIAYLGNGLEDPSLRVRLKALMEVDTFLHYDQRYRIPETQQHQEALDVWKEPGKTIRYLTGG